MASSGAAKASSFMTRLIPGFVYLPYVSYGVSAYQLYTVADKLYSTWKTHRHWQYRDSDSDSKTDSRRRNQAPSNASDCNWQTSSDTTEPTNTTDQTIAADVEDPILETIEDMDQPSISANTVTIQSNVSSNAAYNDQDCFICTNQLHDGRNLPVASLPLCMHTFHKTCIEGVVKWHMKCPVCNETIFSPI